MTAHDSRRQGHRRHDQVRAGRARRQAGRRGHHARASAPSWSATTRAASSTSPASTATAPRSASSRSASTCRPTRRRPRSRRPSASSTRTRPAPATSCSCRCPKGLDANRALELMDPAKDADGLHPMNLGRLVLGVEAPLPCTPRGIVELLRRYDVPIDGAEVVVVGRGITVGRPLGLLLTRRSRERHRDAVPHRHAGPRRAPAPGRHHRRRRRCPGIIKPDHVKPGAAVLDVGVSRVDGVLAGDVAPDVPRSPASSPRTPAASAR